MLEIVVKWKGEKYVEFLLDSFSDPTKTRTGFLYRTLRKQLQIATTDIEYCWRRLKENKPNLVQYNASNVLE